MNTPNIELFKDSMNQRSMNSFDEIKREGINNNSKIEVKESNNNSEEFKVEDPEAIACGHNPLPEYVE